MDSNEVVQCTAEKSSMTFAGVKTLSSPANGQIKVEWDASSLESVAGYNIYLGADFKELIAKVEDPKAGQTVIEDLLHAVVYTIGVRVFDKYGREDGNEVVQSFELANNNTEIRSLKLQPKELDAAGRPISMECVADYIDAEKWQILKPEFYIKNAKRLPPRADPESE